jgi:DNA-binding NarL/FixJ family response regulator
VIDPTTVGRRVAPTAALSERECEVRLVAEGLPNKPIGARLFVTGGTSRRM